MRLFNRLKFLLWSLIIKVVKSPKTDEDFWDTYAKKWTPKPDAKILGEEWRDWQVFAGKLEQFIEPNMKVLEIGCGGGKISKIAAPLCKELTCVDVSQEMLDRAKETLKPFSNVMFKKVVGFDLNDLQNNTFSLVFSHDVFAHFNPYLVYRYCQAIHRVLEPTGIGIISFYDLETHFPRFKREVARIFSYPTLVFHPASTLWFYTPDQISKFLEDVGMKIIDFDREKFLIVVAQKKTG